MDNICLRLFPFSLLGKAKVWFYTDKEAFTTWDVCSKVFLTKYFLGSKTNAMRNRISNFQNSRMKPSRKPGNISRSTLQYAHITAPKSG